MPGIKEKKSIPPPTQAQMLKPHHRQVTPHELAPEEDLGQQVEFEKILMIFKAEKWNWMVAKRILITNKS